MAFFAYVGAGSTLVPAAYPSFGLTGVVNGDVVDFDADSPPQDGNWVYSAGPATFNRSRHRGPCSIYLDEYGIPYTEVG